MTEYTRTIKDSPKTGKITLKKARAAAKAAKKAGVSGKRLHRNGGSKKK